MDCHSTVTKSLLRLLLRHRLRLPLEVHDVSESHEVVVALPSLALAAPGEPVTLPEQFFPDPRFASLGQRAVLNKDMSATLFAGKQIHNTSVYHRWRLCCGVPEGPVDLPVDSALPLNSNLDLLQFVSFKKGCYIGQELTARTKFTGAVRRRFFSIVSASGDSESSLNSISSSAPLPPAMLSKEAGPELPKGNAEGAPLLAQRGEGGDWKQIGTLSSVSTNIALCQLRCERPLNSADDFKELPFTSGTRFAVGDIPVLVRAPPYVFAPQ